jgi:hypothetical protein
MAEFSAVEFEPSPLPPHMLQGGNAEKWNEMANQAGMWWLADALIDKEEFEGDLDGSQPLNGSIQTLKDLVGESFRWGPWVNGSSVQPGGYDWQFGIYRVGIWAAPREGIVLQPRDSRDHNQIIRVGFFSGERADENPPLATIDPVIIGRVALELVAA